MVTNTSLQAFSDRLNLALDFAKFPTKGKGRQVDVAREFKVSQAAARKWLEGMGVPDTKRLTRIAERLNVNGEWLLTGKGQMKVGRANTEAAPEFRFEVPLISWVRAGKSSGIHDPYAVGEGEKPIYTNKKLGPHAFALRVKGDSMEDPRGKRHYPEGSIILVDPDREVISGKPVVARFNDVEEATFKMYVEDNGKRWLKPLNSAYESVEIGKNITICGVVVQTVIDEE